LSQPRSIVDLSVFPFPAKRDERFCAPGFRVGVFSIRNGLALAPMAGITDAPFRRLCRTQGAEYTVAEMTSAQLSLQRSQKSRSRGQRDCEETPFVMQIVGSDAETMAAAARFHVERGADIIDVNMGCSAPKVYKKAAGAALLANEMQVARILRAVVRAVSAPVTLKFRTGVTPREKNATRIARIAEDAGVKLLALHGRTRACAFHGAAEYETVREVKQAVTIPVLVNGDIDSPQKARAVLQHTGADGVMIGRAALGKPWLFREIVCALANDGVVNAPTAQEKYGLIQAHLDAIHEFYGEAVGVRVARKHMLAYARTLGIPESADGKSWRANMLAATDAVSQQVALVSMFQLSERFITDLENDHCRKVA
jgi:tRNA-dihydrouridine synthase B